MLGFLKSTFSVTKQRTRSNQGKDESFICRHLHQPNKSDEMKYLGIINN